MDDDGSGGGGGGMAGSLSMTQAISMMFQVHPQSNTHAFSDSNFEQGAFGQGQGQSFAVGFQPRRCGGERRGDGTIPIHSASCPFAGWRRQPWRITETTCVAFRSPMALDSCWAAACRSGLRNFLTPPCSRLFQSS
jgi:hypothetical protein